MTSQPQPKRIDEKSWRPPSGPVNFSQETLDGHLVWVARDGDGVVAICDSRAVIDEHLAGQER